MRLIEYLTRISENEDTGLETIRQIAHYQQLKTEPVEVQVTVKRHPKSLMKACFLNAYNYVTTHVNCVYVLGYYLYMGIPIEHAWVKQGDNYIDVTLNDNKEGDRYFKCEEITPETLREINKLFKQKGPDFYLLHKFERVSKK